MANFYVYLISSLPSLRFEDKPPFSFAQFLEICQDKIPAPDMQVLGASCVDGNYPLGLSQATLDEWRKFDTDLRNELARIRAERKKLDPLKYQRQPEFIAPYFTHAALSAIRNPLLLDAERMLDQERWRKLDELSVGHYFDLDALVVYAHKLLISERWERINRADKSRILSAVLERT